MTHGDPRLRGDDMWQERGEGFPLPSNKKGAGLLRRPSFYPSCPGSTSFSFGGNPTSYFSNASGLRMATKYGSGSR